jgi:hypothetical protein
MVDEQKDQLQFPSNPQDQEQPKRRGRPPRDGVIFVKKDLLLANQNCRSKEENVVSASQLKKMTDTNKKPLSEAQQAHIKKLLEANAQRRMALKNKDKVANMTVPKEAPEGYVPVVVKGKTRVTNGEVSKQQSAIMEMMKAMQDQIKSISEQRKEAREASIASLPVHVAPKPERKKREKKQEKPKREYKKKKYQSETSETDQSETDQSESETESSDSDSEYLKKYEKKAVKRLQTVKEIETKLREAQKPAPPKSKYEHLGRLF